METSLDIFGDPVPVGTLTLSKVKVEKSHQPVTRQEKQTVAFAKAARRFSELDLFSALKNVEVTRVATEKASAREREKYGDEAAEMFADFTDAELDKENFEAGFTEPMVIEMHRALLDEELAFLVTNENVKSAVITELGFGLQWVFAPDSIEGRPAKSIAFSFVNCCMCAAVDAESLRAKLLQQIPIRKMLVEFKFCREADLPPLRKKSFYVDIIRKDSVDHPDHPDFDNPVTLQFSGV